MVSQSPFFRACAASLPLCAVLSAGALAQTSSKPRNAAALPQKSQPAVVKPAGPLAYGLKAGQLHVYSVRIQLDGPQFVETLSGPAAYRVASVEDGATLEFQSALQSSRRPKGDVDTDTVLKSQNTVRRLGLFRAAGAKKDNTLTIDEFGALLRQSGDTALPSSLGNLSRLLLESLPGKTATTWDSISDGVLAVTDGTAKTSLPSREKSVFTLEDKAGQTVIKKEYELTTRETVAGEPRVKITGHGQTTFDAKAGVPREMEFEGTVAEASKTLAQKTLVKVTAKLLEGKEREEAIRDLKAAGDEGDDDKPIRNAELFQLVQQLKFGDKSARKAAADKLASWPPNEDRPKVAKALAEILTDGDLFVRWSGAKALGLWYTKETVPALIKRLDDPEHAVRWETEKQLGEIADERACMPLAIMVDKGTDRTFAANALEAMGPVAEEVAIKLLGSYAWEARTSAAKMLAKWGTKAAVPTLRAHLRDDNGIVVMAAKDALNSIGGRNR